MAQPGSAPDWGSGGRRFESCHPDQKPSSNLGIVRFVVFGLVGVGLLLGSPAAADTLRQVFAANDISPSPNSPVDLDRSITSYAIENGDDLFAIAYYWANGEPLLPDTLQIAVLNKAARSWTSVSLPRARNGATSTDSSWFAGSVTAVATAYTQGGLTCRDFLASYVRDGAESWLQGEACRAQQGKWEVKTLRRLQGARPASGARPCRRDTCRRRGRGRRSQACRTWRLGAPA